MNFNNLPEEIRIIIYSLLDLKSIFNLRLVNKASKKIIFNPVLLNILIKKGFQRFPNYQAHFKDMSQKEYYNFRYFQTVYLIGNHIENFSFTSPHISNMSIQSSLNDLLNTKDDKEEIYFLSAWINIKSLYVDFNVDFTNIFMPTNTYIPLNQEIKTKIKEVLSNLSESIFMLNPNDPSSTFSSIPNLLLLLYFHLFLETQLRKYNLNMIINPFLIKVLDKITMPEFKNKFNNNHIFSFLLNNFQKKIEFTLFDKYLNIIKLFPNNNDFLAYLLFLIHPKNFPLLIRSYQNNQPPPYSLEYLKELSYSNHKTLFSILSDNDIKNLDPSVIFPLSRIKDLKRILEEEVSLTDLQTNGRHFILNYSMLKHLTFLRENEIKSLSHCKCHIDETFPPHKLILDPFCLNQLFHDKTNIDNLQTKLKELYQNNEDVLKFLYPLYTKRLQAMNLLQTKTIVEIIQTFRKYAPKRKSDIPIDQYYETEIKNIKCSTVKFNKNIDAIMYLFSKTNKAKDTTFFRFIKNNPEALKKYANDKFSMLTDFPNSTIYNEEHAFLILMQTATTTLIQVLKLEKKKPEQYSIMLTNHQNKLSYYKKRGTKDFGIMLKLLNYSSIQAENNTLNKNYNDLSAVNKRLKTNNEKLSEKVEYLKQKLQRLKNTASLLDVGYFSEDKKKSDQSKKRKQTGNSSVNNNSVITPSKKYFKK